MNGSLVLSFVFCFCALRIVPSCPAQEPPPTLVVRNGTLFDPERGEARPLGQLWIRDDRIVGERPADAAIPAGVAVIDARDHTVLPGLFDLHVHVAVHGGSFVVPADPVENLESALLCGVTNVVDLHGNEETIFALRERSRTDPQLARLWCAGGAFTVPKGHATQFGIQANEVTSVDEVEARFAALLPKQPDLIKLILEHGGWGGLPAMPTLDEILARAVVDAAHRGGKRAVAHVWSLPEAKAAVGCGVDALVHGVFLGKVDEELAQSMAKARTAYVPTLSVVLASARVMKKTRPYDHALVREVLHPELVAHFDADEIDAAAAMSPMARMGNLEPVFLKNLQDLHLAGVPIGLGTDAGNPMVPHGPGVLLELELYVAAGLTPAQALHAATLGSAQVLGVAERHGTLAPGKTADLVLVAGEPVTRIGDVWNVVEVVKSGRRVDRAPMRERNARRASPPEVLRVTAETKAPAFPFGAQFQPSTDAVARGKSTVDLLSTPGSALHFRGHVRAGFAYGPWTGAAMLWHPERRRLVDASACTGLRLELRGTQRPLTVTVQCRAVKDYNVFTAAVTPDATMQTIDVPFDSLRQIGFGKKVEWTGTDITGVSLEYRCPPMTKPVEGAVELEVASIRFY